MLFQCSANTSLEAYDSISAGNMDAVLPSAFIEIFICLLGFINNCILLLVAYRIGWFRHYHFYFIINLSMVGLLMSLSALVVAVRLLIVKFAYSHDIMTLRQCSLIFLPIEILYFCAKRSALALAFDRFLSMLYPFRWMRLGAKYRLITIAVCWILAVVQEAGYFVFYKEGTCITVCFCAQTITSSQAWDHVNLACDSTIGTLIILLCAITPSAGKNMPNRVVSKQKHTIVYWNEMEERKKEMMGRVRPISYLTLICYICTMSTSFVIMEILKLCENNLYENADWKLVIRSLAYDWMLVNTVPSLYLYAWKDAALRNELRAIVSSVVRMLRSDGYVAGIGKAKGEDENGVVVESVVEKF